jgi:hypothetical protein
MRSSCELRVAGLTPYDLRLTISGTNKDWGLSKETKEPRVKQKPRCGEHRKRYGAFERAYRPR